MSEQPASPPIFVEKTVRKSVSLLIMRIVFIEVFLEAVYLLTRVVIDTTMSETSWPLLFLGFAAVQLVVLIWLVLRWSNEYYQISADELRHCRGVINKHVDAYPYNNLQSIKVYQGLLGRILGFGKISVFVPTLGSNLDFTEIPHPEQFATTLKNAIPHAGKGQFIIRK